MEERREIGMRDEIDGGKTSEIGERRGEKREI